MKKNLFIELCHPDAVLPCYAREGDAGMDVYTVEDVILAGKETKIIKTGFKVVVPEGFELQVRPRSGLSLKTPLRVANSPGTIDSGYRDEVGIVVQNTNDLSYFIKKGERIAQILLKEVWEISWTAIGDVTKVGKNRGGGFGHTGK